MADPAIDAVMVATPVSSHFEIAINALRAGKHVFIEKPITPSAFEARLLIEELAGARAAAAAGLREGDVILEVNRKDVQSVTDFDRALRNASKGSTLLLVKRGENTLYLAVQNS